MKTTIYFNRDKSDNWSVVDEAESEGILNADKLYYLGYEVEFEIEIEKSGNVKVLAINGTDVSDKDITL